MLVPRLTGNTAGSIAPQQSIQRVAGNTGTQAIEKGLQDLSQDLLAKQDEIDTAEAKQADSDYSTRIRETLYDSENGFLHTLGKNTVDAKETVFTRLKEERETLLGNLKGNARLKAEKALQARFDSALQKVDVHTANQQKTYLNDSANARVSSAIDDAIADPAEIALSLKTVAQEAIDSGRRNGHSNEVIQAEIIGAQTKIHQGVVERVASHDPIAALDYLQTNKTKMTGEAFADLEAKLAPIARTYRGRLAGRDAFNGGFTGGGRQMAGQLLKQLEGFRETPYWDVNALRTGFGSDTITKADGTVQRVTKNTRVTREDADRDLTRRIAIFEGQAIEDIGAEEYAGLPEQAKAALLSITYNYGNVPKRIREAARSGDMAILAAAVRNLGDDNDGVNRKRREQEASMIASAKGGGIKGLLDINDPDERAAAVAEYKLFASVKKSEQEALDDANSQKAFEFIESGGKVDDIPFADRVNLGQETVSSLRTYQDKKASGDKIETDDVAFIRLTEMAQDEPQAFAKLDPLQYRSLLNDADYKSFVKKRTDIREGVDPDKQLSASSLRSAASTALVGAGIGKGREKQKASFERELIKWASAFTAESGKQPTPIEIDERINQMLTPIVIDTVGWGGIDERAFEINYEGDKLDPNDDLTLTDVRRATVKINDTEVSEEMLERFITGFSDALGRPPSAQEVVDGLIESGLF